MEKIVYKNSDGETLVFQKGQNFNLRSKSGFETTETIVRDEEMYGVDGAIVVSTKLAVRDMTIRGEITPLTATYDHEELLTLRQNLIRIMNPKLSGTITYTNNIGEYSIDAIPIFAPSFDEVNKTYKLPFLIQLKALDPYWLDKSEIDAEIPMAREENLFEFPLEITDNFEFSRLVAGDVIEIQNNGDVSVGAVFTINANGILKNPRIYNVITQEYFALNGTFTTGTKLRISTVRGKKRVEQEDGDGWYNSMTKRKVESKFLQIDRGINYLQLQADEGAEFTTSYIRFEPKVVGV